MAEYTEWNADLEVALAEPFPAKLIERKKGKGNVSFVAWHHYVRKLNRLVGHGWTMGDPVVQVVGGKLVMGLPVTILGVTRINFGDEDEESEVNDEGKPTMYGTPVTNAFAQAFKRTMALFGMGLDMYDKKGVAETPKRKVQTTDKPADDAQLDRIGFLLEDRVVDDAKAAKIRLKLGEGMNYDEAFGTITWLERQPPAVPE